MKTLPSQTNAFATRFRGDRWAFTLVESLVTMAIFGLVMASYVGLQLFALRQDQVVESKLGASDQARNVLERLGWEARSARTFDIGNTGTGTNTTFTKVATNTTMKGTAIRLYTTDSSTSYIQYYFDTNQRALYRLDSGGGQAMVSQGLTNNMAFQCEDYRGAVLSNVVDSVRWRSCIRVIMEFAEYKYPLTQVRPGALYDYYKIEYKVSPHCPHL